MTRNRPSLLPKIVVISIVLGLPNATAWGGPSTYSVDVLSQANYPIIQDSYMMRINNLGVAAGYIATQSVLGPYLPTTYASAGQFNSLATQSVGFGHYYGIVTGINDRGDVVGNVTNADNSRSMYVERGGTVQTIGLPDGGSAGFVTGIGAGGLAYGQYTDSKGFSQVFTASGSTATLVPLAISGLQNYFTDSGLLSRAGILGIYAYAADFSANAAVLYNLNTSAAVQLAVPAGFTYDNMARISTTGVYGSVDDADFNVHMLASWNLDGSFRGFIGLPTAVDPYSVVFNNLGQAVGLDSGNHLEFYDGTSWTLPNVPLPSNYTLAEIDDFNDRGDFVGLADNGHGFEYGFVATVVPEPASLAMLGVGLAGVAGCGVRRRPVQGVVDSLDGAVASPTAEVVVDRPRGRKVMGAASLNRSPSGGYRGWR